MTWIRKAQADDWHYSTDEATAAQGVRPIDKPCVLLFFYSFRKNMLDSSNCAAMSKMIEDSLTRSWILKTDTNAHVKGTFNSSIERPMSERKHMELNTVDIIIVEEGEDLFKILSDIERIIY